VQDGPLVLAPPASPSDSRSPNGGPRDVQLKARGNSRVPWFARLPPELRRAIRARAAGRAPRGYEERLRRYFESID